MANFTSMSAGSSFASFNNTVAEQLVRFRLNISKKSPNKDTVLSWVHNGTVYRNTKDDSGFMTFRPVSNKSGAVPMEYIHTDGSVHTVDSTQFIANLFSCGVDQTPDVKFTVNLTGADGADDLQEALEANGSLIIDVPLSKFYDNGLKEHNGREWVNFYLGDAKVSFGATVGRNSIDADFILNCLSNAVVRNTIGQAQLSRYVRRQPVAPVPAVVEAASKPIQQMANTMSGFTAMTTPAVVESDNSSAINSDPELQPFSLAALGITPKTVVEPTVAETPIVEEEYKELPQNPGVGFGQPVEIKVSTAQPDDWADDDQDFEDAFFPEGDEGVLAPRQNALDVMAAIMSAATPKQDNIL